MSFHVVRSKVLQGELRELVSIRSVFFNCKRYIWRESGQGEDAAAESTGRTIPPIPWQSCRVWSPQACSRSPVLPLFWVLWAFLPQYFSSCTVPLPGMSFLQVCLSFQVQLKCHLFWAFFDHPKQKSLSCLQISAACSVYMTSTRVSTAVHSVVVAFVWVVFSTLN